MIAETAKGVATGKAEGIVVESRHEDGQATRTIGMGDAELIFTAEGGEDTRGAKGNHIYIEILADAATASVDVTANSPSSDDTKISITPKTGETTANQVAALVNGDVDARDLVTVASGGTGQVGTASLAPLMGGEDTDGKLVAVQAVVVPRGKDTGPGYADPDGAARAAEGAKDNHAYTANSNGFFPGFIAIHAKGKADPGEPFEQGWWNAFVADFRTKARLLWMPLYCAIEVPGFDLNDGPNQRSHNSMRMGLGTDEPETSLHIRTAVAAAPEIPEIILDNANPDGATNLLVGRIAMRTPGTEDPKSMIVLTGEITNAPSDAENAKLSVSVAQGGTLAPRWHLAGGLWSEGVTGGDKGAGSINADQYYVAGKKIAYKDATTGFPRLSLGPIYEDEISGGEISFAGSNMVIIGEGGAADTLDTITGGNTGDLLMIRQAATSDTITVVDSTSIKCGASRVLGDNRSLLLSCISSGVWSAEG